MWYPSPKWGFSEDSEIRRAAKHKQTTPFSSDMAARPADCMDQQVWVRRQTYPAIYVNIGEMKFSCLKDALKHSHMGFLVDGACGISIVASPGNPFTCRILRRGAADLPHLRCGHFRVQKFWIPWASRSHVSSAQSPGFQCITQKNDDCDKHGHLWVNIPITQTTHSLISFGCSS